MSVNYKKIKKQVKPFKAMYKGERDGYMFYATDEQMRAGLMSIAISGRAAKRHMVETIAYLANTDRDFAKFFKIN